MFERCYRCKSGEALQIKWSLLLQERVNWRPKGSSSFKPLGSCLALVASWANLRLAPSVWNMFPPPMAWFGCDNSHLLWNPRGWPLEPFISAGQRSSRRLAEQLVRFYYVNVFLPGFAWNFSRLCGWRWNGNKRLAWRQSKQKQQMPWGRWEQSWGSRRAGRVRGNGRFVFAAPVV